MLKNDSSSNKQPEKKQVPSPKGYNIRNGQNNGPDRTRPSGTPTANKK